ncbi:5' nucleotidase, NT5C type [Metabacillus sp. RGM 3146]|uniref:5' nucleotidase, NT5C type n=1 Tax=Metabacillus sp. RGM 3146 TaxID=3401092 RepID=UPI003B9A8A06
MIRFGIDIDGTITPPETFVPYLNKSFGINITLEDIMDYDLTKAIKVSEAELDEWMEKFEPIIYSEAPLSPNAKPILDHWKESHQLIFISARKKNLFDLTKKWFDENNLSYHHIELVGTHDKIETVKKHRIDVFFEDKHDNACMISEECNIPVILFNTPYNQDPVPEKVIRVSNWLEAEKWVNQYVIEKNLHMK